MKYIVIKQFNDLTGFKLPGESIELDDVRAAKLRAQGLIGGVWKDEPKPEITPEKLEELKKNISREQSNRKEN